MKKKEKKNQAFLELLVDSNTEQRPFNFNPYDSRFKAIFNDPKYSIDPTDNSFKRDPDGNSILMKHQLRKRNLQN